MSTEGMALPIFTRGRDAPKEKHPIIRQYERFTPIQGWTTFILLVAMLFMLGDSVIQAEWVETPGLTRLLFLSALMGLALSKVRLPAVLLHPIGISIGLIAVIWQIRYFTEEESVVLSLQEIWSRLNVWYEAATSNGISADLLPFALGIMVIAWMIGYFSSWFAFRSNNAWVGVVIAGTGILTNLSFLPDKFSSRFFLFTLFAMLLIVRMSVVQRQALWRRTGMQFNLTSGWLTMHAALWFSVAVLLLAALLPMKVWVSQPLAELWSTGREPVARLEDHFARLFAGIPSRKDVHGRFFGDTLPFIGEISFGGEVVFWANSDYPSYWLSQTYSEYTSQGWKAGETTPIEVGPDAIPPPRTDFLERVAVDQSLQLSFSTNDFLSGGSLDWLSHDAVLQALAPKEFEIDLLDDSNDHLLPDDLQSLAPELREELETPPEQFIESYVTRLLPDDLVLNSIDASTDEQGELVVETLSLERKESVAPDIVSWKFADRLREEESYSMVSFVSMATDDQLRNAGTRYSNFIKDHYLQLPPTLPERVRAKAEEVTEGAETPLDKALAIQQYLRGDEFTYSQEIDAPPRGADGVDNFLFETKTGYSDYFASTMTVMLRAVGVPARMAAGYAPGEYDEESQLRVIRDFDSHGWVQVYFPSYGWIDFEPTPKWPVHERKLNTSFSSDSAGSGGVPLLAGDESEFLDPSDLGAAEGGFLGPGFVDRGFSIDVVAVVSRAGIALGVIAALWLLAYIVWNWGLWNLAPVEKTYAKLSRLGVLAGIRLGAHQTPVEYAIAIENVIGDAGPSVRRIAWAFASDRYAESHRELDEQDRQQLDDAWKSIRGSLLAKALRRLTPGG